MKKILVVLLVLALVLMTPAMAEGCIADAIDRGGSLNIVVKIDGFDGLENCALRCDIQPTGNTRVDLNLQNAGEKLLDFSAGSTPDGSGLYVQANPLGDQTLIFNADDLAKTTENVSGFLGMMGMVSDKTASEIGDAANSISSGDGKFLSKIDPSKYDLSPLAYAFEELAERCVRVEKLKSSKYAFFATEEKAGEAVQKITIALSPTDAQLLADAFRMTVEANPQLPDWTEEPLNSFADLMDTFVAKMRGALNIEIGLDADDIPVSVDAAFTLNQQDGARTYTFEGTLEGGAPLGDKELVNPIYPGKMNLTQLMQTGIGILENVSAWIEDVAGRFGGAAADSQYDVYAEEDPYAGYSDDDSYGDFSFNDLLGGLLGGSSDGSSTYGGSSAGGSSLGDLLGGLFGGSTGSGSSYGGSQYGSSYNGGSTGSDLLGGLLGGSTGSSSSNGSSQYGSSSGSDLLSGLLGSLLG